MRPLAKVSWKYFFHVSDMQGHVTTSVLVKMVLYDWMEDGTVNFRYNSGWHHVKISAIRLLFCEKVSQTRSESVQAPVYLRLVSVSVSSPFLQGLVSESQPFFFFPSFTRLRLADSLGIFDQSPVVTHLTLQWQIVTDGKKKNTFVSPLHPQSRYTTLRSFTTAMGEVSAFLVLRSGVEDLIFLFTDFVQVFSNHNFH